MELKFSKVNLVKVSDWNTFIQQTYNRPYKFQSAATYFDRDAYSFVVPYAGDVDADMYDSIPESPFHPMAGVKFAVWLDRHPFQELVQQEDDEEEYDGFQRLRNKELWWEHNFYPSVEAVANDLHAKGLLEAGEYVIDVNW